MCGRFTLISDLKSICERFEFEPDVFDWIPRYNIAPGQPILSVLTKGDHRVGEPFHWGLVLHWSKSQKSGYHLINVRSESLTVKPYMKSLLAHHRCLIPSDGFYEWVKEGSKKIPYRITLKDHKPFAFAGVWDHWQDENGNEIQSVAILTSEANQDVKALHERMPVILRPDEEALWINPEVQEPTSLLPLLNSGHFPKLTYYEVSPFVNSWKNESPECIKPAKEA